MPGLLFQSKFVNVYYNQTDLDIKMYGLKGFDKYFY